MTPLVRLVDDDEELLRAFSFVLRIAGLDVAAFPGAEAFLGADSLERPGCIVLDLRMQGMNGLECQAELNRRGSDLPVLFMSGHGDVPMAMQAVKAGAADFLAKPVEAEALAEACGRLCEWSVKERARKRAEAGRRERLASLSPRELEVAGLVAEGLPNKAIAQRLGISEPGVKFHRGNLCRKLGVRTAVEVRAFLKPAAGAAADGSLLTLKVLP